MTTTTDEQIRELEDHLDKNRDYGTLGDPITLLFDEAESMASSINQAEHDLENGKKAYRNFLKIVKELREIKK